MDIVSDYALINKASGEIKDIGDYESPKQKDIRFIKGGHKMYNNGILGIIDMLTKDEIKRIITMFDAKTLDYYNILTNPFHKITSDMSKSARSRFKHKLLDSFTIAEFNGKIMLNPNLFIPRGDKNIKDCKFLTQRAWDYLFTDCDKGGEDVESHIELIFGEDSLSKATNAKVGSKEYSKFVKLPKDK